MYRDEVFGFQEILSKSKQIIRSVQFLEQSASHRGCSTGMGLQIQSMISLAEATIWHQYANQNTGRCVPTSAGVEIAQIARMIDASSERLAGVDLGAAEVDALQAATGPAVVAVNR